MDVKQDTVISDAAVTPSPSTSEARRPKVPRQPALAKPDGLTPAMRQYIEQKKAVGDAILLFRMGDFYETFYDDAKTIAHVLGLTLTARDKNSENPVPLAGVPYHAVDRYVAKLVRAGFRVAISEQMEDPKVAKGVVKRDVVRIITPGTLTDEALLEEREGNLLVAIFPEAEFGAGMVGLACVEISSGQFFAQMIPASGLCDELARIRPAELLVPETAIDHKDPELDRISATLGVPITPRPAHLFDTHMAERSLREHFKVSTLSGIGFDTFDASLRAAAALLDYLQETQKTALGHILKISPRASDETVLIDQVTLRSLEVERTLREAGAGREGSLLGAIDLTTGAMGARLLRNWLCYPLRDVAAIEARQQAIADFRARPDRLASVRDVLKEIPDLERILGRIGVGRAMPRDVLGLAAALQLAEELAILIGPSALINPQPPGQGDLLSGIQAKIEGHGELAQYLLSALKDNAPPTLREVSFIADGFDAELDRLRAIGRDGAQWLANYQARESERTGIATLKVAYNSVFGYYIEITHQHRDKIPHDYIRKQTVRNAERYITDELKRYETEALGAADQAKQVELDLFAGLVARAAGELPRLQEVARAMATLDVLAGLAELSRRREFCRPIFERGRKKTKAILEIVDGRHPVLDKLLAERFVPNDCALAGDEHQMLVITGPNMAGKSTYIRQVALLTLLAHTGSYVPARSMRLSPVDRIFARVGASDELARGQSTFMVEMVETARILHNATSQSLVILDEIGRGTSTYDGLAIAWAITEHIARQIGCRTLFATHYHELTELADQLRGVANFNVAVKEQLRPDGFGRDVVFLHKIVPGPTDRSYGVHVAAMAGLPPSVVARSESVLEHLEARSARERSPTARAESEQLMLFGISQPAWCGKVLQILESIDLKQVDLPESPAARDAVRTLKTLAEIVRDEA